MFLLQLPTPHKQALIAYSTVLDGYRLQPLMYDSRVNIHQAHSTVMPRILCNIQSKIHKRHGAVYDSKVEADRRQGHALSTLTKVLAGSTPPPNRQFGGKGVENIVIFKVSIVAQQATVATRQHIKDSSHNIFLIHHSIESQ
jgi:hypothetical protein